MLTAINMSMAIYHFNIDIISRSKGMGSAVAAAAYRHDTKMKSDFDGKTYSYKRRNTVVWSEISLPVAAPQWACDAFGCDASRRALVVREATGVARNQVVAKLSAVLWNGIEQHEAGHNKHHKRARLARKFTIALPVELTREEQITVTREYVQKAFAERGMVADWVVHDPQNASNNNPHVLGMVAMRELGEENWGLKNRDWNARDLLRAWRSEWAEVANIALECAGFDKRIDHRRLDGVEVE